MTSQNQGWRSGSAPKSDKKPSRDWRRDRPAKKSNIRWGRVFRLGGGFLALITALIVLAYLFLFVDERRTQIVQLGPTRYQHEAAFFSGNLRAPSAAELRQLWDTDDDKQVFLPAPAQNFSLPKSEGNAAVMFLHAVAVPEGDDLLLLEQNASPNATSAGQSLKALVKGLPRSGRILLLIDIARVNRDRRLGISGNDFLQTLSSAAADHDNLVILTSCGLGERSWSSRHRDGHSVFAHFVAAGIRGAANETEDRSITASELIAYVQGRTRDWVAANRGDIPGQHPQCIPALEVVKENDFVVARVSGQGAADDDSAIVKTDDVERRLNEIGNLWKQREGLAEALHDDPLRFSTMTNSLMRAEEFACLGLLGLADSAIEEAADQLNDLSASTRLPMVSADSSSFYRNYKLLAHNVATRWQPGARTATPESTDQVVRHCLSWFNTQFDKPLIAPPVIARAVDLQELAENAFARSVGVREFVGPMLVDADRLRRDYLDSLFTSTPLADSDTAFDEYRRVLETIKAVNAARQTLNRALFALPYLTDYVADLVPDEQSVALMSFAGEESSRHLFFPDGRVAAGDPGTIIRQTRSLVSEYGVAGRITAVACLARMLRARLARVGDREEIQVISAELQAELDALVNPLTERARKRVDADLNDSPQPSDWRAVGESLRFPFVPADARLKLLQQRRTYEDGMAKRRNEGVASQYTGSLRALVTQARWHSFWLLQLQAVSADSGPRIADAPLGERAQKLGDNIGRWLTLTSEEDRDQYRRLVSIGRAAAKHWQDLGRQAEGDLMAAMQQSDVSERRRLLDRADFAARCTADYEARALVIPNPPQKRNAFSLVESALACGDRALAEFWTRPDDRKESWYLRLAKECRDYAKDQPMGSVDATALLGDRINRKTSLMVSSADNLKFARRDEKRRFDVSLKRTNCPPGHAAIWLLRAAESPAVRVRNNGLSFIDEKIQAFELTPDPDQACHSGTLNVTAFLRGHVSDQAAVFIDPCSHPDSVTEYFPGPDFGQMVVRGNANRSILFLLDWSRSMGGNEDYEHENYQHALRAIRGVVKNWRHQTDRLGLMIFGHRVSYSTGQRTINRSPLYGAVEGSGELSRWDYELLAPPAADTTDLQNKLNQLGGANTRPYGMTPLLHALENAVERAAKSGGAVVVVTDGVPTDMDHHEKLLARIRATSNVGIAIIKYEFVAPNSNDRANAARFGALEAKLIEQNVLIRDAGKGDLQKVIASVMPPRTYVARRPNNNPLTYGLGTPTEDLASALWSLNSGKATVPNILIRGGDFHEFQLVGPRIRRFPGDFLIGRVPHDRGEVIDDYPQVFGHRSFRIDGNKAAIEVCLSHENLNRPVHYPAEAHFDVTPAAGERPPRLVVERAPLVQGNDGPRRVNIPTWRITVPNWPNRQPARVSGWWKGTRTKPDKVEKTGPILVGDKALEVQVGDQSVRLKGRRDGSKLIFTVEKLAPEGADPLRNLRIELGSSDDGGFRPGRHPVVISRWRAGIVEASFDVGARTPPHVALTTEAKLRQGAVVFADKVPRRPE